MRFITTLTTLVTILSSILIESKHLRTHHPTHLPTHLPTHNLTTLHPTMRPSFNPPQTSTPTPTWAYTPQQYYYYAQLFYERAAFDYNNFPHVGPAFYNAQENEIEAKYLESRGKLETEQLNKTLSPT